MGLVTTANTVLDLTTLARVKAALNLQDVNTTRDAAISAHITAVSTEFAGRMKRWTKSERRTELCSFSAGRKSIVLRGAPMTLVHKVELSASDDFSASTPLVAGTDYHLDLRLGLVHLRVTPDAVRRSPSRWPEFPAQARVEYTGGLAVDTATLVANYPDLAGACDQQVIYLFQRTSKNALGSNSVLGANGETKFEGVYKLLPTVEATLDRYTRRTF